MKKQEKKYANIDIKKIFMDPPKSFHERIILLLVLSATFILFFRPIQFSQIKPLEAIFLSAMSSVSLSWGWIVLLRSIFKKSEYIKN